MKIHFWNQSKTAKPVADARNFRTWCGREVNQSRVVKSLPSVQCLACREAFAAVLRRLPNVEEA